MKKFEIITESDARQMTTGESVILARHGHVTPLANDTLRERRIQVIREGENSVDELRLAPPAEVRRVVISSDHVGVVLRQSLTAFLRGRGLAVNELGGDASTPVDYPDVAVAVARPVACGEADAGIIIDGAGIGSAIVANKIAGVRAVMATSELIARYSREHNGANVLTLGSTLISDTDARAIVGVWLTTPMTEPRYIRRLTKIRAIEQQR